MVENGAEMDSVKFSVPDQVASDLIQQYRKIYPYYATGAVYEFVVSDQSGISYFPDSDRGRTMVMYWSSKGAN